MQRKIILFALAVLIILAAVWVIFRREREQNKDLILYGNVDVRQVDIGFRVAGRVDRLFFEEGDVVKEGDLLTTLDPSPYDQQLKQAKASVKVAQAAFANAEYLLKRRMELIDVGGISQEDLQNTQASYTELEAQLEEAKASEAVAEANLNFTKAYCPEEGIILTRIREPGTVLNSADPVYTVSISSPVWIRAYVDERRLGSVYYGMPAEIHTDTRGGKVYKGKIGFISPVSEFTPKTVETTELRTDLVYRLRIYAENPDHGLKQGMPVTVKLTP